jgi:hypothetical protein
MDEMISGIYFPSCIYALIQAEINLPEKIS